MKICREKSAATSPPTMKQAISKILLLNRAAKPKEKPKPGREEEEAALAAEIFAAVAAVKAEYSQLQLAQSPYDAAKVQSCDKAIVFYLQKLSLLKQARLKKLPFHGNRAAAELLEQRSLARTFEAASVRLESELREKESELLLLKGELSDGGFPAALRRAVKSVRAVARAMTEEMTAAGWDLTAAAAAISPGVVLGRAEDVKFSFESFVGRILFSDFHLPDFGLGPGADVAELTRSKYKVFPSCGGVLPESRLYRRFSEAARRVWGAHRLFFSGGDAAERRVFQVRPGTRFSEVYMENVVDGGNAGVVGFTVVPGFCLGMTIIRCRVYPARAGR